MTTLPRGWLIIYAALLLVVLGGGGMFFSREEQLNRRQAINQLDSIAQLKIRQIRQWRTERLGDAQMLVDTPLIAEMVNRWLAAPAPNQREGILAWFDALEKNYQYTDILLVDPKGEIRLSLSGNRDALHQEALALLTEAAARKKAMLSDLHRIGLQPPHQDVLAPLFVQEGQQQRWIGTILLRIDAGIFLYPMLQSWPVASATGETSLVRRDGEQILFLNALRHRPDSALRLRVPAGQNDLPADMAASGRQGVVKGIDYRGREVIAVAYRIPETPWSMIAKIDTSEALSEWRTHATYISILMVGACLVLTAGLGVLWQRTRKEHYRIAYQAEVDRREREARYHAILLSVGDGVIVCDSDGRVTLLNPVAETLTGWQREDALGRHVDEVFHIVNESTGQAAENPVERVLRQGVVVSLANHTKLIARDGAERPIADSGAPIFDDQHRIVGVVLVFRDQSEERVAEAKLRRTTQLLERAEEMAEMGCWEFDFATKMVWASPSARRIYGLTGETWTIEEVQRLPLAEYRVALNRALKELVLANAPYDIEFRIRRPSDSALIDIRSQAEYNAEGNTIFGIIQDITALKQAESALRESESRYRSLFQNNHAVMLLVDPNDGAVVDANPAATCYYGWSHAELLAKNINEINVRSDGEIREAMDQACRERRNAFAFRHRLADGSIRDVEVISGPIMVAGQERLYSIVQDVTDRHRAEEQRQRLQEQLLLAQKLESVGRLAGGVAHDFNNLLSPILGYSELLQENPNSGPTQREQAGIIHQAAIRARDLVRQLLAFGRKQTLVVETVDLNEVIRAFFPLVRRTVREDIRIDLNLSPLAAQVRVDIGQIEQVIMNLMVNAQDAMPDGGLIVLETKDVQLDQEYADGHASVQAGPHVLMAVTDTGCGMSEEVREQIFNPFYTTKKDGQGTGLGLATTYGIVKQHGGNIWVYSELGHGTSFKIYLPVAEATDPVQPDTTPAEPLSGEEDSGSATLMVVEDNAMVRELTVDILSHSGYTVLAAASGAACLQQLRSLDQPLDLLLTDVVMPVMNGKVLYQEAVRLCPGLRVLYMSGYTENVIGARGVLDAGIHFIHKPFTPKTLLAKVREVLRAG